MEEWIRRLVRLKFFTVVVLAMSETNGAPFHYLDARDGIGADDSHAFN